MHPSAHKINAFRSPFPDMSGRHYINYINNLSEITTTTATIITEMLTRTQSSKTTTINLVFFISLTEKNFSLKTNIGCINGNYCGFCYKVIRLH